jgi:hypothetical protein
MVLGAGRSIVSLPHANIATVNEIPMYDLRTFILLLPLAIIAFGSKQDTGQPAGGTCAFTILPTVRVAVRRFC